MVSVSLCTRLDIDTGLLLTAAAVAGNEPIFGSIGQDATEERARIVNAFTRAAVEQGYARTSIEDVARRAGLPVEVFGSHFASKEHCLTAAYDAFFERLFSHVADSVGARREWPAKVHAAVAAALEFIAEASGHARLFLVEALSDGPGVLERYFAFVEQFAAELARGRRYCPRARDLPPATEEILVGGALSKVRACLLAEDVSALPQLGPEVVETLLSPYLGLSEARRVVAG